MIYVDFESILVRENNGNQNPTQSYTNKYHKHAACSYAVIKKYVLMINLVSLLSHTYVKIRFAILLIV